MVPPNVPDWSLSPMTSVEVVAARLFWMKQVPAVPMVERPLTVSLKPFRFQKIVPVLKPCIKTLPLPKPFGMTSLLLDVRLFPTALFRAVMIVSPLQELFALARQVSPVTVESAHNVRLNGPEIGPIMA